MDVSLLLYAKGMNGLMSSEILWVRGIIFRSVAFIRVVIGMAIRSFMIVWNGNESIG